MPLPSIDFREIRGLICTSTSVSFQAKITGTPVTYENFMVWKLKFVEERKTVELKIETKSKLTGIQINSSSVFCDILLLTVFILLLQGGSCLNRTS
jgi:hypothetical protein